MTDHMKAKGREDWPHPLRDRTIFLVEGLPDRAFLWDVHSYDGNIRGADIVERQE